MASEIMSDNLAPVGEIGASHDRHYRCTIRKSPTWQSVHVVECDGSYECECQRCQNCEPGDAAAWLGAVLLVMAFAGGVAVGVLLGGAW